MYLRLIGSTAFSLLLLSSTAYAAGTGMAPKADDPAMSASQTSQHEMSESKATESAESQGIMSPGAKTHGAMSQQAMDSGAAARCAALSKKFQKTITAQQASQQAVDARIMSENGSQLCASGMYDQGMAKIRQAIDDLTKG